MDLPELTSYHALVEHVAHSLTPAVAAAGTRTVCALPATARFQAAFERPFRLSGRRDPCDDHLEWQVANKRLHLMSGSYCPLRSSLIS